MIETLRKRERLLLALIVVGLVLAAVASTMYYARLDLTSTRMFTLSDAAKALRNEIPESVRISYFVSKSLADRHPGPGEIEDFLHDLPRYLTIVNFYNKLKRPAFQHRPHALYPRIGNPDEPLING